MHVTDISNAARTNLMDIHSGAWHEPTMALFGATAQMLPNIKSNAEVYGCGLYPGRLHYMCSLVLDMTL